MNKTNNFSLDDFGFDFIEPIDFEQQTGSTTLDYWSDDAPELDQSMEPDDISPDSSNPPDLHPQVKVDKSVDPSDIVHNKSITRRKQKKSTIAKKTKPKPKGRPKKPLGKYHTPRPLKFTRPANGYATVDECRAFLASFNFKSVIEMKKYMHDHEIPPEIPVDVKGFYNIPDMREFLYIKPYRENMILTYEQAKIVVQSAGIKNLTQYQEFSAAYNIGRTMYRLPRNPHRSYGDQMITRDFLGHDKMSPAERSVNMYPFAKAREYVRTLGLQTPTDWREYTKSKSFPMYIPKRPDRAYLEFAGYKDWLGTDDSIVNLLNNVQQKTAVLGLFHDGFDDMYVYQMYTGGYAAVAEFIGRTGYKLVRAYTFEVDKKSEWLKLVEDHSDYHEMNMFTTFNILTLLFEADALYPVVHQ